MSLLGPAASTAEAQLFTDNFDRADTIDINVGAPTGQAGSLLPLNWVENFEGSGTGSIQILSNQLQVATGAGMSSMYLDHNFNDAAITTAGGFSVTLDVLNINGAGDLGDRFGGYGVGMTMAEANAAGDIQDSTPFGAMRGAVSDQNPIGTPVADLFVDIALDNNLRIWNNGTVLQTIDIGAATGTIRTDFTVIDFNAGSLVLAEVYVDGTRQAIQDFKWDNTDGNYLGVSGRANTSVTLDNFGVDTFTGSTINQWQTDADSNWNNAANWTAGSVPNGPGAEALFGGAAISTDRTVTVDAAIEVDTVIFTAGPGQYTVADDTVNSLTLSGNADLQVSGTHEISATISGSAGLNKSLSGTLILSGNNTYTGTTNINAGNLTIASSTAIPAASGVIINADGQLVFDGDSLGGGFSDTFSNAVSGNGTILLTNQRTTENLTLTGNNSGFSGLIDVNDTGGATTGALIAGANNAFGSATATVDIRGAFVSTEVTGGVTLPNQWNLGSRAGNNNAGAEDDAHLDSTSGNNTLTGSIVGVGGDSNHNIFASGTSNLTISNTSGTPSILSDDNDAGIFRFNTDAGATIKVGNEADPGAGKITGAVDVRVTGAGTTTIATANAIAGDHYTGTTTVEDTATLEVLSDGSLDQGELLSSSITVNSGATLDVDDFTNYFIQPGQNLGGAGTVVANNLSFLEASSITPGDSVGTLTITGNANLLYFDSDETTVPNTGVHTYELGTNGASIGGTNDLVDISGNLDITTATPGSDQFLVEIAPVEGSLDTANDYTLMQVGGSLTGNSSGANFAPSIIDNLGNTLTTRYSLSVSTASGDVTLQVGGVGPLSMTWIGDSTGVWDVASGTDWDTGVDNIGDSDYQDLDNVTFDDDGTTKSVSLNNAVAPGSLTVNNSAGNDYDFSGTAINGFGDITKIGDGVATFSNASITTTGDINANGGRLVLNTETTGSTGGINIGASGTLDLGVTTNGTDLGLLPTDAVIVNNGVVNVYDAETIANMTGTGSLVVQEETTVLGDNTGFDGGVTIKSGAVALLNQADEPTDPLGSATGGTTVEDGGSFTVNGPTTFTTSENFTIAGAGLGGAFDGAIESNTDAGVFTYNGTITLNADTTLRTDAQNTAVSYNGAIDGSSANATLTMSIGNGAGGGSGGSTTDVNGGLNLGTGGLTVAGTGTAGAGLPTGVVNINSAATYSGDTNIGVTGDAATVNLVGPGTLGSSANINVGDNGTLNVTATTSGDYTIAGQTLNVEGTVEGDINATAGSTVTGTGVFSNDLSASGSTVQLGGTTIQSAIDQGLIARYNFEPGAETTDSSTNSNDLTFGASAGATIASAAVGTGAGELTSNIDNDGNRMTLPDAADPDGNDSRTISLWFNSSIDQENNATLFGGGTNLTGERYDVKFNGANLRVEIQGTGVTFGTTPAGLETDGLWHHVAAVLPQGGDIDDVKLYLDGVELVNNGSGNENVILNTTGAAAYLGDSHNGAGDRNFQGLLDDVQIYNTDLSALQVADIFNNPGNTAPTTFTFLPETLTVDGNYSQDATSTLQVDLVDAVDFDKLAVGGTASLDGGLDLDFEAAELTLGDEAVILTSTGLTGDFDNAQVTGHELTAVANTAIAVLYEGNDVRLLATYQGDANGDKKVSLLDLNALGVGFGLVGTATWQDGDFNYDGDVSLLDLNALGVTFGNEIVAPAAAPVVPEPASLMLLGLGGLALMRRR